MKLEFKIVIARSQATKIQSGREKRWNLRRARNNVAGVGTSPPQRYQSNQILFGDDFTKPAVIRDEFLNEFMHAVLEDVVHVTVLQGGADAAGMALRGALAAIGDADLVEIAHQIAVTAGQRTRQGIVEDQK